MDSIVVELSSKAPLGVKLRVYSGAALSILDGLSDAWMIRAFLINGQTFYAMLSIGSLCLNIFFQLILVFLQTMKLREHRRRTFLFEAALGFTFVKPGYDAHQVATSSEQQPGFAHGDVL
jgi:hypothetical protein